MNKNEKDYNQGKIYKIISDLTDEIYIGSTKRFYLSDRLAKHKWEYNSWLRNRKKYVSVFEIIKLENFKIVLIENYPCNSRDELNKRKQYHIDKYNSNLANKHNRYNLLENNKTICECGCFVRKSGIAKHKKTNKHIKLMTEKE